MIKMECIRLKKRGNIFLLLCLCLVIMLLMSCRSHSKKGFTLQRFEIKNDQLESIIKGIHDSTYIQGFSNLDDKAIIMVLRIYDSLPEFCFASTKKEKLSEFYIYTECRRIVGYIDNGRNPIIVLSDMANKYEFEWTFYKFLVPTSDKRYFDYIYFPDDQYEIDEYGYPSPPPFFDPHYYYFAYKDEKMVYMNYYNTFLEENL